MDYHHAGILREAEQIYRQMLQADPRHAGALHLLGMIAYQVGKHELAVQYGSAAIRLDGRQPEYHSAVGRSLSQVGAIRRSGCLLSPGAAHPARSGHRPQ